ncbi:MAG: penicillin-binding protein 2 [Parcubacteria group bacterium Gr01-1014_38]|nr:MAG: penicillin-binding protein 2 [Parcubacteria group bacterium Gr01-1014_38]
MPRRAVPPKEHLPHHVRGGRLFHSFSDLWSLPESPKLSKLPPPIAGAFTLGGLRVLTALVLLLLFAQSLRLQIAAGSLFRKEAESNRVRDLVEYAPRGIFLDRLGKPLAQNIPAVDLVADPAFLPEDLEPVFADVKEALPERNRADFLDRLRAIDRRGTSPVPILEDLSHQEFLAVSARANRLPGLQLETTAVREYRGNGVFAHALGYTGKLSPEERKQFPAYLLTESLGKTGLERQYEERLRGRHGIRQVEVNAQGVVQHDLGREPPEPGSNIRLHLDAELQERAAAALARGLDAAGVRRGVVVALEPHTGAVRSLVSLPTYPQSDIARGTNVSTTRTILADPDSPFLNRVTQGQYVPGSTFKLAVASAGLEEGVITSRTTVESTGGIRVGQWFFPDWKPGGHGRTDIIKALAESVNTYFYTVAGGMGDTRGVGIERLAAWAKKLGFGEPTGIDLPQEASGFLPSPEWKEEVKGEAWYIGDTYHAAIGQGDVLITPLQLAVAASVIANGGTLLAPRLIDAIEGPDGSVRERVPPAIRVERTITPETASIVRAGMRAAVTSGSARGLNELPVAVAAKTGTAQVGGTDRTHAWVTVFGPVEDPDLALVVLLEGGGGGDRFAVPVARDILSWYFAPEQRVRRAERP